MSGRGQTPAPPQSRLSSGPQGTRLFSAEELRQYAQETMPAAGRASVNQPVLEGVSEGFEGRRFSLRTGRQTIGRRGDNDLVLDDMSVSASHAWIMVQQGQYVLMNTLSTNGTFVNGKRIHEAALKHGDRVRFGQAEFTFLTHEPDAARSPRRSWMAVCAVVLLAVGAMAWWLS